MKPTEKQAKYVQRIMDYLGMEKVESYVKHFYPSANIDELEKEEAQKIITGLSSYLPGQHWGGNGMSMGWIQNQ